MGLLQFRIQHNLQDDSCAARGDCFYTIEEEDQTAAWLAQIAADSDLAVLHWDRAATWLAFDVDPGTVIDFQYDPGSGPAMASFDLERSYRNFVLYLYAKLQPDYFAIMIEVNMFKAFCPGSIFHPNWPVRQPQLLFQRF